MGPLLAINQSHCERFAQQALALRFRTQKTLAGAAVFQRPIRMQI
jgi:hypothetical protein